MWSQVAAIVIEVLGYRDCTPVVCGAEAGKHEAIFRHCTVLHAYPGVSRYCVVFLEYG